MRKLVLFLVSCAIVSISCGQVVTLTPTPLTTATQIPASIESPAPKAIAPTVGTHAAVVCVAYRVNFRIAPSTQAAVIRTLADRTPVEITGAAEADKFGWQPVRVAGISGYIYHTYICEVKK